MAGFFGFFFLTFVIGFAGKQVRGALHTVILEVEPSTLPYFIFENFEIL